MAVSMAGKMADTKAAHWGMRTAALTARLSVVRSVVRLAGCLADRSAHRRACQRVAKKVQHSAGRLVDPMVALTAAQMVPQKEHMMADRSAEQKAA